jgi:hypothetical protein
MYRNPYKYGLQDPEGGGMVGAANQVYDTAPSAAPTAPSQGPDFSGLARAMGSRMAASNTPQATGSVGGSSGSWLSQVMGGGGAQPAGGGMGGGFGTLGAGGEAGGSSMGSSLAAAGPWAALAAAIIGNETYQTKHGNRASSQGGRTMDLLSGKDLERDADKYLGHVPGAQWSARWGNPEGAVHNLKDMGRKLRGLF